MRQEILTGPERRRRWSDEEKIAIVREAGRGDLSVAAVARRHDITRQHIYQWRGALRQGRLIDDRVVGFLPVEVSDDPAGPDPYAGHARHAGYDVQVEVGLVKDRMLRVPASIPAALLTGLIRATEAA